MSKKPVAGWLPKYWSLSSRERKNKRYGGTVILSAKLGVLLFEDSSSDDIRLT